MDYGMALNLWKMMQQAPEFHGACLALQVPRTLCRLNDADYGCVVEESVANRRAATLLEEIAKGLRKETIRGRKHK